MEPDADCSFNCPGNSAEKCGAGNRLSTYVRNSTSSPSSTPTAPPPLVLPANWTSQGCWVDGAFGRILTGHQFDDNEDLTIESCIASCSAQGFSVAGVEYAEECWCDNQIKNGGVQASPSDCSMACPGNSGEVCGGPNRLSVYSSVVGNLTVQPAPTVQKKGLPGSWAYKGCLESVC